MGETLTGPAAIKAFSNAVVLAARLVRSFMIIAGAIWRAINAGFFVIITESAFEMIGSEFRTELRMNWPSASPK